MSYVDTSALLSVWKKDPDRAYLSSVLLQQGLRHLYAAYTAFWLWVGASGSLVDLTASWLDDMGHDNSSRWATRPRVFIIPNDSIQLGARKLTVP